MFKNSTFMFDEMPVDSSENSMAEYVTHGIGQAGKDEIRQTIMPSSDALANMLLQEMQDLKCVDLSSIPSQNIENSSRTLSLNSRSNEDLNASLALDMSAEKEIAGDISSAEDDARSEKTFPQVPCNESLCFLPMNFNKRNPWRRISGFHASGNELMSATYPARSSVKKLRFAQAKKPLNYLYSYFSLQVLDCDDQSSIMFGVTRKDYPSKMAPGKNAGSIGYCSDSGSIFLRDSAQVTGPQFSKGDVVGCGIVYPSHYKKYADLSTDDNSDGMTDVVLTSLLNRKSMDFVCNVLNLNVQPQPNESNEMDYYNENFVESRTQVEVYFTCNMQVIGKVLTHVPIGGFFPTLHVFSRSAIKVEVELHPPTS